MTRDDVGGTVVWSKLVHPSYRTIDLRTLLRDASQELPPPPFDMVHIVTAQDCVAVQLTIIEHPEPPPELAARTPTLSGAVHLPAGWLFIDPPAAPLPGHVDLSGPGEYAYAAYQDNGAETEAACQQTIVEHLFDDPYDLTAALDRYTGQERWTVHFWPTDERSIPASHRLPRAGSSIHPVTRWISPDEDGSVSRRQEYRQALNARPRAAWARFLDEHSGLPGPRGNLELVQAAADEGDREWFEELAADPDEYRATVGAVGLGRLLAEQPDDGVVGCLVRLASDPRWRVREGVAMALQRLGDADPPRLWGVAARWAVDEDPLVQRAAVAGVCEPRLLGTPDAARQALDVCAAVTTSLAARPPQERPLAGVRALRQALGYGWSVAVAADPQQGLPRFRRLQADPDPDVAWIVRENRKKARLIRVMPPGDAIEG